MKSLFLFFLNSIQVVNRVVLHNQKIKERKKAKKRLSGLYYVFFFGSSSIK